MRSKKKRSEAVSYKKIETLRAKLMGGDKT
jgi:hypothetical protein